MTLLAMVPTTPAVQTGVVVQTVAVALMGMVVQTGAVTQMLVSVASQPRLLQCSILCFRGKTQLLH